MKIRDGRAAVSVCSDPRIGNPRRLLSTVRPMGMGRSLEVRRKSENLPVIDCTLLGVLAIRNARVMAEIPVF